MPPKKRLLNKIKKVIKRNGTEVPFQQKKIENAIYKALLATGEGKKTQAKDLARKVVRILNRQFKKGEIPTVEQIQDAVEDVLILNDLAETAKAYILYREKRRLVREAKAAQKEALGLIDNYLQGQDWEKKENSNMAFSLQGLNHYVSSHVTKQYWLNKVYPKEIRQAVQSGDFHIHDLDLLGAYCCGWDLYDLLTKGFGGVPGKIQSKPAKHFRAALGQIVNFFYTLQGEAAGAEAFSNFDTLLAPFIRYDKLKEKEVKQALQEFMFNANVPTRVGFQTPFENITLDLKVPSYYKDMPVIRGGQPQKETYGEFQKEMDILNRKLAEVYTEGDANGRVFTFPIPTYSITKDFDWDNPVYDNIWQMTAKYGIPYFCLDENTEIFTERGVKKIKDVSLKDRVLSDKGVFQKIVFKKKVKSDESIALEGDKFSLVCSPNHRFPTKDGLKMAQNLSLNDHLLRYEEEVLLENGLVLDNYYRQFFEIDNLAELKESKFKELVPRKIVKRVPKFHYSKNRFQTTLNEKIKIPNDLNKDLMELIGIVLGDGSIKKNVLRVINADKEIIDFVVKVIKSNFGLELTIRQAGKSKVCKEVSVNSAILVSFLEYIGIKGNVYTKRIPEICFWRKEKEIDALLRGLFDTDGTISLNRRRDHILSISFANQALIKDVLALLAKRGIVGKISGSKHNHITITGERNIRLFRERIGFRIKRKERLLLYPCKFSKHPSIGDKIVSREEAEKVDKFYAYKKGLVRIKSKSKYPYLFVSSYRKEIKEVPIKKIEVIRKKHILYDLTVSSKNHLFVLRNGIISHNSNFVNSDLSPEDARSMCCRLRLDNRELYKRGGGLFGANPLTGCYDEKTQILTKNGWKHFRDLTLADEVFTLSKTNNIEVYKPKKIFVYDWDGNLYRFKAKSLDLLVTPNHKMVVDEVRTGKRKLVPAEKFDPNNQRIPKQGKWLGKEVKYFVLPEIENKWIAGNHKSYQHYRRRPLKILMDDWLRFFGIYIAEGSVDNIKIAPSHGYRVFITQIKKKTKEEIKSVLDNLPFHYRETDNGFVITNKQLWDYLSQFGNDKNRFLPKEIKMLSARQLRILFDWLVKGDGHIRPLKGIATKRQITYYTISRRLADEVQEIAMKIGWMATISERKVRESYIRGRKIQSTNKQYIVGVQQSTHYRLRENNIKLEYYRGKVYSCEVTNHTLFVRRNGKACWSGNSIGVVTINLPRLGYLSKTKKEFFQRLEKLMDLAKTSLEIKRKVLEDWTEKGLYPYSKYYLEGVKKIRHSYWGNHFSTIGLIGMNEALLNFMGVTVGDKKGVRFAEEIMDFMRDRLIKYQKETGNLYNLEATPAEGTSYRLALMDKKKYPDIITAGEKEPYYTNSTQLPVNYTDDLFEALQLQDPLQTKYTGGTVFHAFLGEAVSDPNTVKSLLKTIFTKFRLPYFTFTPTFSICPVHGYIPGEHFTCPYCKRSCEVYSRVVGYLRPVQQWHKGKQEEFKERKTFKT